MLIFTSKSLNLESISSTSSCNFQLFGIQGRLCDYNKRFTSSGHHVCHRLYKTYVLWACGSEHLKIACFQLVDGQSRKCSAYI